MNNIAMIADLLLRIKEKIVKCHNLHLKPFKYKMKCFTISICELSLLIKRVTFYYSVGKKPL